MLCALAALAILGLALVAGCGSSTQSKQNNSTVGSDQEFIAYLWDTWGIRLSGYQDWDANYQDLGGGKWQTTASGYTELDGQGKHAMSIEEDAEPVGAGEDIALFVTDEETGELRFFDYNVAEQYVNIGGADQSVTVLANPDGSYEVWTYDENNPGNKEQKVDVANGYQAVEEVERRNGFKNMSPHLLLTAFALAHTPTPGARVPMTIIGGEVSNAPSMCSIFQEFCDCTACLALQKTGGTCDLCPDL